MQPNSSDDRSLSVPGRDESPSIRPDSRESATQLMREQIDRIYDANPNQHQETDTSEQPHSSSVPRASNNHDWQNYHTQWQQYYQQYYERYYVQQVQKHKQENSQPGNQTDNTPAMVTAGEPTLTKDEAVSDIRNELINKIQTQSVRLKKSRHFIPILSAVAVMLVFLLLQYNRLMFAQVKAFVSPGSLASQNLIVDPLENTKVGPEPRLIIPKLNVDAPVVFGLTSLAENQVQNALRDGVVHYPIPGANSNPGEQGNSVILGHSSNDVFDDGNYKFIFVQLEQLQKGDSFYVNYNSTRYTYTISRKEVILPTEVSKLTETSDKPQMILITCVPVGTALKRLIIYAYQVIPDPAKATQTSGDTVDASNGNFLPGNSPSLFDRLFGS